MTQCERILNYIREHGEITQRDAIKLGCYRLSARIADLRAAGEQIDTEFRAVKNADGTRATIGVYSFRKGTA